MDDQEDKAVPERNDWAITSLWLGVISLLPYMIALITRYLERRMDTLFFQVDFLIALFCLLWGIVLGPVSLITGIVGIRQINNSEGTETGIYLAILGIVLGIIGIIANIRFDFLLLVGFMPS